MNEDEKRNWARVLWQFAFLVVRTKEGAKLRIGETSRRHGVGLECGVLLYQSWICNGSCILETSAPTTPRDWAMDGLLMSENQLTGRSIRSMM